MPESWSSSGVWMLPSARITSRLARCSYAGAGRDRTPPPCRPRTARCVASESVAIGEVLALLDGVEERVGGAHPSAVLDGGHRVPDAFVVALVEVFDALQADRRAGVDHLVADHAAVGRPSRCRAARWSSRRRGAELVALERVVGGEDRVPTPPGVARALEAVPVGLGAAVVDHAVDRARAAERLAAYPRLDACRSDRTARSGRTSANFSFPRSLPNPRGMRIMRLVSLPPASSSSTRMAGSSDRRLASTQPAEPAPTTM